MAAPARRRTLPLFAEPASPAPMPDLASYDVILVNSSAGKDSQAMLDHIAELARAAGVMERVVVVHCDLDRMEWPGTRELAEEQARHYGFRFEVVRRTQNNLLQQIEARWLQLVADGTPEVPAWPSSTARYCTSDHKRAPVRVLMTLLTHEVRARRGWLACSACGGARRRRPRCQRCLGGRQEPVRILNCLGLRGREPCAAEEGPVRAR